MFKYVMVGMIPLGLAWSAAEAQPPAAAPQDHANRIILLGTKGGPTADPARSEPANLLVIDGAPYLIDAGAGVAHQLAKAGYPPTSIRTIFITHHHLDHTAGLEPLIALSWIGTGLSGRSVPPANVYGPPATEFLVKAALKYVSVSERIFRAGIPSLPHSEAMFFGHDLTPGPIYSDDKVKVTAVENSHFGHASTGPDGKKDMSFSYRFDTPKGSIVFTGDTGPSDAVAELAKGADILVSEVYLPGPGSTSANPAAQSPVARDLADHMAREHLNPQEVGKLAAKAGVKQVILTHIVAANTPSVVKQLEDGVHEYYQGPVIVGHDLLSFDLDTMKVGVE